MATKTVTVRCPFCGSEQVTKNGHNRTGKQVYRCNNPVYQRKSFKGLGVTSMQGLYNRLIAAYPRSAEKRQYHNFPVPHRSADGRFRATVTLYWTNKTQRLSIAGRTLEDYEMKVSHKLREVCLMNRFSMRANPEAYEKSLDSIQRFQKVIKTKEIRQEINDFLKPFISELENGQTK